MNVRSIVGESVSEIKEKIDEAISDGFKPTLAISFSSVAIGIEELNALLGSYSIDVFGLSSSGEILANEDEDETVFEQSCVLTLLDVATESYALKTFSDTENVKEIGVQMYKFAHENFSNPQYIIGGCNPALDGEQLIKGILEHEPDANIFGGLAGDDGAFENTFIFTGSTVISSGGIALIMDGDKISVEGIATSGWSGVSAHKVITSSQGNVVSSIDGERAYDSFVSYFELSDADMPGAAIEYPLLLAQDNGSHVLRCVVGSDKENGTLTFAGTVPEGESVKYSASVGSQALESSLKDISEYRTRTGDADLLILFSCIARHIALGPLVEDEIELAQEEWDAPMVGFFTYGEIGKNNMGHCGFHNETFTLTVIKEK